MKKLSLLLLVFIISSNITGAYTLTQGDTGISNTISEKVLIHSDAYIEIFSQKIEEIIHGGGYSDRVNAILEHILLQITASGEIQEILSSVQESTPEEDVPEENIVSDNFIDLDSVKNNWLTLNNGVRDELGLASYSFSKALEDSALVWSTQAQAAGEISHKRDPSDGFYDYENITSWFADNGVVCENVSGITHTENIWWGRYACSDGECTDELTTATNGAFDYYMAEKGTSSDAHYRSLTQEHFTKIGLGISTEEVSQDTYEYYLTIHYCTELIN